MPGFNPQQVANNVQNGNNVAIMLGDTVVIFAQTVGHQLAMGTEQLYGIGTASPQEVQQLRMSPSFSLDSFSLTQAGITLLSGGTRIEYILAGNSFDMHVVEFDGVKNATIFTYVGAKAQNLSQSIPANAPLRSTFSFLALDVLDANGNSIMSLPDNAISVASNVASLGLSASNLGLSG